MSKLDDLIKEFCPNGVEWVSIQEISIVSIGEFVHKNLQNDDAIYPVYNGGVANTGFYEKYNRTANKIIISARGANAGFVNRVFTNYWSGNSCYSIEVNNKANWNFVYYCLKSREGKLLGEQQKGGIPAVSKKQVEDFHIPLPPLPVQEEIVRILTLSQSLQQSLQQGRNSMSKEDEQAVEDFKATHYLTDEDLQAMQGLEMPAERTIQDYRSTYNDIRDWLRQQKAGKEKEESKIDWDDVVFEVDLLKSQEINLDYILELIFEKNKKRQDKASLVEDVRRLIRSSVGNRAKESLMVDFINQTDLDKIENKANIIDAFFAFAQAEQRREAEELINSEELNIDAAKRYITASLKREFASENGTELNEILPKMSPLNPKYLTKKQSVFQKIAAFVEKFKGVGGEV